MYLASVKRKPISYRLAAKDVLTCEASVYLVLKLLIFHFLIRMFLAPLPMVYTFSNLFDLQEYVLMLMTPTIKLSY